jgi:hypothetical protein
MSVRRLVPPTLGWQELYRSVALDGEPQGTAERIPTPGWLVFFGATAHSSDTDCC